MNQANRETLLAAKRPMREVILPGLPENANRVFVASMSGRVRAEYEVAAAYIDAQPHLYPQVVAKLVLDCVVNADGVRMFTPADADAVSKMDGAVIQKIQETALELSGMTPTRVKDIEGN